MCGTFMIVGPIIGGALGGIVFLASVGGLCFWCKRRHPSDAFFDVPGEVLNRNFNHKNH